MQLLKFRSNVKVDLPIQNLLSRYLYQYKHFDYCLKLA